MITSTANKQVKQICNWIKSAKDRKSDQVFIAEGRKMFMEAPKDWIKAVYASETFMKENEGNPVGERLKEFLTESVTDEVFTKMSDTRTPQGVLCVLKRPAHDLSSITDVKAPFLMVLEDIQDPGNLGTIVRTAEGAGVTGIIMSEGCVDIFNPKTIRSTMGSIYRMPFVYVPDVVKVVKDLNGKNITTYAAHLKGEESYHAFDYRKPTAFLIGNEGNGLSDEITEAAKVFLRIPMEGEVESLNAAIASAVLMYEAHRQRTTLKCLYDTLQRP